LLQALPKFRGDSDIGTFIFTITERRVTDFLRTRYRDRELMEKALADTEKLNQKDLVIRQRMMFVARLLTRKEIEVFKLLSRGATNPEIAEKLFIDYDTVRSHMKQLYVKANIRDRVKLVLLGQVLFGTEQNLEDIFTEEIACEFPILEIKGDKL
jgi:DNA-binding CsgD family transcriptional regulator